MLQKIFCLFTLLTATFLSAQTIPRTENICFFQDAKTGKPITIVNDSLVYKGELKNPTLLKHTDYLDFLTYYQYHFNIKQHSYLVHAGCGPVLEYRNDSIVRIDNSFLQKNQYGASPFVYKDQICLFGGYGLFSDKNFITRFDNITREWFRLYTNEEGPNARKESLCFYDENGLYIFGGWQSKLTTTLEKDPHLWHLDYSNMRWKDLGNYNKNIIALITTSKDNFFTFQTDTKLFLVNGDNIATIDFINNKIAYFENKELLLYKPKGFYFDSNLKSLVYLEYLSGIENLKLESIPLSQFLKYPIKTEKLYSSPWQEYASPLVFVLMVLLVIFGVYKWILFQKGKCFVFHKSKNIFYYKSKIISNLDPLEEKILSYLYENKKTFIQLNQLNSFFEKENQDNFSNVIKKRDLVFNSLLVKLNAIINQEEKSLVLMQKNEADKRIKEIRLNPLYFTLK